MAVRPGNRTHAAGEDGQVMATFVVCLAVLMAVVAIVADLAPAFSDKVAQRSALDRVEQELALPSSALVDSQGTTSDDALPSGADTALKTARRAVAAARAAGFTGTVEVWFYEPAENESVGVDGTRADKVDANDRLWAWCVRLTEDADTMLSGFTGTSSITVSTETAGAANPYARARVYRSASSSGHRSVKFTSSSGTGVDSTTGTAFAYADAPQKLKDAFESAYRELRDRS